MQEKEAADLSKVGRRGQQGSQGSFNPTEARPQDVEFSHSRQQYWENGECITNCNFKNEFLNSCQYLRKLGYMDHTPSFHTFINLLPIIDQEKVNFIHWFINFYYITPCTRPYATFWEHNIEYGRQGLQPTKEDRCKTTHCTIMTCMTKERIR